MSTFFFTVHGNKSCRAAIKSSHRGGGTDNFTTYCNVLMYYGNVRLNYCNVLMHYCNVRLHYCNVLLYNCPGEWERKSMTCNVGTAQTCHTCLIWHQGLHQRLSEIFDLSEDTFIVLFAKLSFQSRFWWNSAELQHEKECRARKLLNVFYN